MKSVLFEKYIKNVKVHIFPAKEFNRSLHFVHPANKKIEYMACKLCILFFLEKETKEGESPVNRKLNRNRGEHLSICEI